MQRIKYTKEDSTLFAEIYDIYANKVLVSISNDSPRTIVITKSRGKKEMQKRVIENLQSLQNAKRKVRKILKEEFEVNLQDEVRKVLCI